MNQATILHELKLLSMKVVSFLSEHPKARKAFNGYWPERYDCCVSISHSPYPMTSKQCQIIEMALLDFYGWWNKKGERTIKNRLIFTCTEKALLDSLTVSDTVTSTIQASEKPTFSSSMLTHINTDDVEPLGQTTPERILPSPSLIYSKSALQLHQTLLLAGLKYSFSQSVSRQVDKEELHIVLLPLSQTETDSDDLLMYCVDEIYAISLQGRSAIKEAWEAQKKIQH